MRISAEPKAALSKHRVFLLRAIENVYANEIVLPNPKGFVLLEGFENNVRTKVTEGPPCKFFLSQTVGEIRSTGFEGERRECAVQTQVIERAALTASVSSLVVRSSPLTANIKLSRWLGK